MSSLELVLDPGSEAPRVEDLMARRSLAARARRALGRDEPVVVERVLYWPIALVRATARGTGRRQWVERVQGAVDLVSERVGLVDIDLPPAREVPLGESDRVPARLSRTAAELAWHELFRDHVDRRYKPLRPPALSLDHIERVWLPNQVVSAGGRRYLVDPLVGRVRPLRDVPAVEAVLREAAQPSA